MNLAQAFRLSGSGYSEPAELRFEDAYDGVFTGGAEGELFEAYEGRGYCGGDRATGRERG